MTTDKSQRARRKVTPIVRPWDVVTLKGCTSHYRVYSLPGGKFLYACLYADCILTSDDAVVDLVLPNATRQPESASCDRLNADVGPEARQ